MQPLRGETGIKRFLTISVVTMLALVLAAGTALAQNGNPCPGDKEYQLNIIGVDKGKKPDMKGNSGHRIFVWLGKSGHVTTKIFMTGDSDPDTAGLQCEKNFRVLDANGTDDGEATLLVPCDPLTAANLDPDVCFSVYATALGGPGGHAHVDVVCEFDDTCIGCDIDGGSCATGDIDFTLTRGKGKPVQEDITGVFRATGCIDLNASEDCDSGDIDFRNEWIFNIEQLLEYFWDYTNHGLRISQIRFCDTEDHPDGVPTDCGPNSFVP